MSQIKVARYSGVKYEFVDGYARVPVLEGEFDQAHFAHCALQPGCSITPEVYSVTEHNQLFIFTKGKGYVTTPRQAWNIREPGVFVPEFDAERFTITCSADSKQPLEFLHIITELSDYDKTCLVESRMVLPRFRGISEGWTYDEDFKDNDTTTSIMLLEHRNLGRLYGLRPRHRPHRDRPAHPQRAGPVVFPPARLRVHLYRRRRGSKDDRRRPVLHPHRILARKQGGGRQAVRLHLV